MQKLLLISVIDQSAGVVIKTLENIRQGGETDCTWRRVCSGCLGACRAAACLAVSADIDVDPSALGVWRELLVAGSESENFTGASPIAMDASSRRVNGGFG